MAAARITKEEGRYCSLDTFMANELNVTIKALQIMVVYMIKECTKDPIVTTTGNIFQMHTLNDSIILPGVKTYTGVERRFRNNVSI